MTKKKTTEVYSREEGERTATGLFGFMGKARLYNTAARDVAVRIIEKEMANESDPVEYEFFKAAIAFINSVDAKERAAMVATYGGKKEVT
jgi:hypothetical protein